MAVNGYEYRPDGYRFYAGFVDDTRRGFWAILDNDVWDDRYILTGLSKEQAIFGVEILQHEGVGHMDDFIELQNDLLEMIEAVTCTICEKHFMRAQLHNDRCPADQT